MNEEEAIEYLKNYIECLIEDFGYYKDIVEFRDSVEYLEKRLQTQQAEIKKKDKQIEQYQNMLATNDMLHVIECEKNDKIIDEMAKWLNEDDTSFGYGKLKEVNTTKKIKQYFERKVENGN